ncbi:hypothetical protein PQX77_011701 [Marasmius sp. AFHP31]|nr:hypothetical protein PQX77_011701 [Marasmius sp. AFHP31]
MVLRELNSYPTTQLIATTPSPPSSSTSPFSENNVPASSIPVAHACSRADPSTIHGDDRTPGQLYASLLSTCRLGYPLWQPSPRLTAAGKEYLINIGDVGICSDLDPFHTLFNITHGEQVPENVDPLCDIEKDITVKAGYHRDLEVLAKPKGAISEQGVESSVFTFSLSEKEGALLMLPRGGVLKKLQNTYRFKTRIKSHWRQWYKFAEEAGDLDEGQTLCLLTGIERCSTWAMAGWDAKPGRSHTSPDSLKLTVDNASGQCFWSFPPAGCWTQSALEPTQIDEEPKETVFVRGIWINRTNGSTSTSPSPPPGPSGNEDGDGDEDPGGRERHSRNPYNRSQRATYSSQNPLNPFCHRSSSNTFSSTKDSPSDCDHTAHPESHPPPPGVHQLSEGITINLSEAAFDMPPLLDSDYVAFSQDEDWMDVLEDFDKEVWSGTELLRRICGKLKFVAEGGAIYTEIMTTTEIERIQQSMGLVTGSKSASAVVPVLFQLREPSVSHTEDKLPGMKISSTESTLSREDLPGGSDSDMKLEEICHPNKLSRNSHDESYCADKKRSRSLGSESVEPHPAPDSSNEPKGPGEIHSIPTSRNQSSGASGYPSVSDLCPHGYYFGLYCWSCHYQLDSPPVGQLERQGQHQHSPGQPLSVQIPPAVTNQAFTRPPSTSTSSTPSTGSSLYTPSSYSSVYPVTEAILHGQPMDDGYLKVPPLQRGSPAVTSAAIQHRIKKPAFYCDVPGCTSQGFADRHNLSSHAIPLECKTVRMP